MAIQVYFKINFIYLTAPDSSAISLLSDNPLTLILAVQSGCCCEVLNVIHQSAKRSAYS